MAKKKSTSGKTKTKSKGILKKVALVFVLIMFVIGSISVYLSYNKVYKPNVQLNGKENVWLYIKTGSTFKEVSNQLMDENWIKNQASFEWVAEQKGYRNKVKAGRYKLKKGMSNNELVNLLRSGMQEPVKVVFTEARTKQDFVDIISKQLEVNSKELMQKLNDNGFLKTYNLNSTNALTLFIPNTYEFYWNTSAEQFVKRMAQEYQKFWTEQRIQKGKNLGLSKAEISILASIVQQESRVSDEQPTIAGVYLNRLSKGMRLQADPTVIFAVGDFTIKRVLNIHLEFDSPYNTYKYVGLPPGPICIPYGSTIDAVLNRQIHNYIYFCAKEDFSGRHNFATTLAQHERNAAAFRKALNKRKIFK